MAKLDKIHDELMRRGYLHECLSLGNQNYCRYTARNQWKWLTRENVWDFPFIPLAVRQISKNKLLSYYFADQHDIPTPPTIFSNDKNEIEKFILSNNEVIAKPLDKGGSVGVIRNLRSADDVNKLYENGQCTEKLIFQKYFRGEEIRMTVLNGKVFSTVHRASPCVVGDGVNTLEKLVEKENSLRLQLKHLAVPYPPLSPDYENIKMNPQMVIDREKRVKLYDASMIRDGASVYGVSEEVHSTFLTIAKKLATDLDSKMLVIDLIVQDFTKPAHEQEYTFLEFNTAPSIGMYYSLRGGDKPDIVTQLVDMIDEYAYNNT